ELRRQPEQPARKQSQIDYEHKPCTRKRDPEHAERKREIPEDARTGQREEITIWRLASEDSPRAVEVDAFIIEEDEPITDEEPEQQSGQEETRQRGFPVRSHRVAAAPVVKRALERSVGALLTNH